MTCRPGRRTGGVVTRPAALVLAAVLCLIPGGLLLGRRGYLEAKAALAVIEHELAKSEWIVGKKPTIADIGSYAIVRYAPEAMIDLTPYPNIVAWKKRIEAMPGFGTPEQILPLESRLI